MAPAGWTTVPRSFSWLLPGQSLVAGVAIYSTNFVFGIGSIPFILAVVATGLHFTLGLYFCFTQSRAGRHHLFVVPALLVAGAGLWCAGLYYFANIVDIILALHISSPSGINANSKPSDVPTWAYVGCGTTGLNVVLDFALVVVFLVQGRPKHRPPISSTYISNPVYAPPPIETQYQYQQQPQPSQQYTNGYTTQTSGASPMNDSKSPLSAVATTATLSSPYTNTPSPAPYVTASSPIQQTPYYPYDRRNRIDVIRRLCSLQHPDGHWDYAPELADLVRLWGGRELMAPAHGVTALSSACLTDLCNYVWAAQREGREQNLLSQAEMISLQTVNWDLSWAKNAIDRATAWMTGFR